MEIKINKVTVFNLTTWKISLVFCFIIALQSYRDQTKHLGKTEDSFNSPGHVSSREIRTCYIMRSQRELEKVSGEIKRKQRHCVKSSFYLQEF